MSLKPVLQGEKNNFDDERYIFINRDWFGPRYLDPQPFKYRKFAIRNKRFRLINNKYLYDMENDIGQTRNVIKNHTDVAEKMRSAYDKWWEEIKPCYNKPSPMIIGAPQQKTSHLCTWDWLPSRISSVNGGLPLVSERLGKPYAAAKIAKYLADGQGAEKIHLPYMGSFAVSVARTGKYRFRLGVLPSEAKQPCPLKPGKAFVKLGNSSHCIDIKPGDNHAILEVNLDSSGEDYFDYLECWFTGQLPDQQWWFRQLFKNGTRQTRSRYPNDGQWLTVKKTDPAGEFKDPLRVHLEEKLPFGSLARKESEAVMFNLWSISRARISASNDQLIQTRTPLGWIGHGATSIQPGRKLYLEHAFEFIDQPGEWYLDRDEFLLYYMAGKNENPNDAEWIAPYAKQLLRLQGRNDEPVCNLKFEGIAFEHAAWQIPLGGYAGIQAGYYGTKYVSQPTYSPLMGILCEYTDQCTFENITLAHTGTSGIGLGAGCNNTLINASTLDDIGGTGILVGWRRIANEPPRQWFESGWADSLDVPKKNQITNNVLSNCGQIHLSSTGMMTAFTEDTLIAHNEIRDMPHIGITIGFIWDDHPTTQKRTIVEYNHIHHCMKRLIDGAGVYTLGYQPGTIVRNNYIHDILNGHGLYTDEGSSHILFENNVCYRMGLRGFNQNYGHHNIIRNNMFIYPCLSADGKMWGQFDNANFMLYTRYLDASVIRRNRGDFDVDGSFIIERNIMLFNKGEYFNTNHGKGTDTFEIDNNVIWDTRGGIDDENCTLFEGEHLAKWRQRGHDKNSITADPIFIDLKAGDFKLKKDSPAFKVGFKPINLSNVGPQK